MCLVYLHVLEELEGGFKRLFLFSRSKGEGGALVSVLYMELLMHPGLQIDASEVCLNSIVEYLE